MILRSIVRALRRRWPLAAAAACASLAFGLLLVPGAPSRSEARARIILREPESPALPWSVERARDLLLSEPVLLAAAGPQVSEKPDFLRALISVERESSALVVVSTGGGALARVNAMARAAESTLPGLRRAELDAALVRTEATLKAMAAELEKLPAPAQGRGRLDRLGGEVADLEREISSLSLGIDQLAGRLERGEPGPVPPVDTAASDRIAGDLDASRRRLEELRALHPEEGPMVSTAAADVEDARLRLAQARNREILGARFAPVRAAVDGLREMSARRDRLTLEISRKRAEEETARRESAGAPTADVEARRRSLAGSIQDLEIRRARLSAERGSSEPTVSRIEPAVSTSTLASPLPAILLASLLLAVLAAWAAESLVAVLRTEDDVRRHVNLPLLGMAPLLLPGEDCGLPKPGERGPLTEPFDAAAALLVARASADRLRLIAVTSPQPGEGKSTVAAHLAAALARGLQRVLLIDGDLRRPSQHRILGLPAEPGLAGYLTGSAESLDAVTVPTEIDNLSAIPAGAPMASPLPYFRSERLRLVLPEIRELYDFVILDLPPVRMAAETLVAAPAADAVLLVLAAGETGKDDAAAAKRLLRASGAKLIGCILNKAVVRSRGYYTYEPAGATD